MAKFEIVSRFANPEYPEDAIHLPVRATKNAAGYDFAAAESYVIVPYASVMEQLAMGEGTGFLDRYSLDDVANLTKKKTARPALIATGIKVKLADDEYLEISARSSLPLKHWLVVANGVGIIDADYYNNPSNEGEIFFQLINLSPFYIEIHKGDFIGQGIIKKYYKTEDDAADAERTGGFGSTH